jgi:hypothetical protein
MKKCIFILALSSILSISLGWNAFAQIPKEGTFTGTNTYAGTHKVNPIDKDRLVILYENSGVIIDDSQGSPFNRVASNNVGVQYWEKGIGRLRGYVTLKDKDGDKVVWEITETEAKPSPPNPVNGSGKFLGGTGKFTGIQGSMEYTRQMVRSFADGTHQGITKYKGSWKLP